MFLLLVSILHQNFALVEARGEVAENERKQHMAHTYPKLDYSELYKILVHYQLILCQFGVLFLYFILSILDYFQLSVSMTLSMEYKLYGGI